MPLILIPLLTVLVNDFLKVIVKFFKTGKFRISLMFKSGGMPSGHTAFVSSALTVVFLELGPGSIEFMVTAIFAIIVMYDARGIRKKAGDQAKAINRLQKNNIEDGNVEKLEEVLGHSNLEVMGGFIFGVLFSFFLWKTGYFLIS